MHLQQKIKVKVSDSHATGMCDTGTPFSEGY